MPRSNWVARVAVVRRVVAQLHGEPDPGDSDAVVQSQRVSAASSGERVLGQREPGRTSRTGAGDMGFLGDQEHATGRTVEFAISGGDFQYSQPRQLQYPQPDHVHAVRGIGIGRSDHQHIDDRTPGAVWAEVGVVVVDFAQFATGNAAIVGQSAGSFRG